MKNSRLTLQMEDSELLIVKLLISEAPRNTRIFLYEDDGQGKACHEVYAVVAKPMKLLGRFQQRLIDIYVIST